MRAFVEGIGLLGPGLDGWDEGRRLLTGQAGRSAGSAPVGVRPCELLPVAERRRTGLPTHLAIAVGRAAFTHAGRDPAITATVFSSSCGDGENIHQICATLATPEREISPTRFHNSVHNAPAGYWNIALRSQEASTSLCAHDLSFASGLLNAVAQVAVDRQPVALIAYDQPYPEPLHALRPIPAVFGVGLVLVPEPTDRVFASIELNFERRGTDEGAADDVTPMPDPALEALRTQVPAARSLPLLAAFARGLSASVVLGYGGESALRVWVRPWPATP